MSYFDRFDIALAYYTYMHLWHSSGLTRRDGERRYRSISVQLSRMRFRPPRSWMNEDSLGENSRAIYDCLVEKWEKN